MKSPTKKGITFCDTCLALEGTCKCPRPIYAAPHAVLFQRLEKKHICIHVPTRRTQ